MNSSPFLALLYKSTVDHIHSLFSSSLFVYLSIHLPIWRFDATVPSTSLLSSHQKSLFHSHTACLQGKFVCWEEPSPYRQSCCCLLSFRHFCTDLLCVCLCFQLVFVRLRTVCAALRWWSSALHHRAGELIFLFFFFHFELKNR